MARPRGGRAVRTGVAALVLVAATLAGGTPVSAAIPNGSATAGAWSEVGDWNFIPIHAGVLDDGRVMTYGGTRSGGQGGFEIDVWDPALGFGAAAHTTIANDQGSNLFCSFSLDDPAEDRKLLLGGERNDGRLPTFAAGFDSGGLTGFASMRNPRWYPTATTLWDGRILVQGGVPGSFADRDDPVRVAEVYAPGTGWRNLEGTRNAGVWATENYGWWYPKSHVTPAGRVWNLAWDQAYYLDPDGDGAVTRLGTFPTRNVGGSSASVMYDTGLVLQVGGGERGSDDTRFEASAAATIVDLNHHPPVLRPAASMNLARHWADAIVLPDGRVLVVGGSRVNNENVGVATAPEIWDPTTDTWTVLAPTAIPRLYHSTALLLTDGSIFVGGGGAPGPQDNLNAEVFYPPYLYAADGSPADRPAIVAAPTSIGYDQAFTVDVDRSIDRVTLIKSSNATHGMSTQVFQELAFSQSGGRLQVESPDFATVATPGRYLLFALDADGVPSEAAVVSLRGTGLTPPPAIERPANLLTNGGFEAPTVADGAFGLRSLPGWTSSDPNGLAEVWGSGHAGVGSAEGRQHVELNVSGPVTLSQQIAVVGGARYRWSVQHRGRADDDTIEILVDGEIVESRTAGPGPWLTYEGEVTAPAGTSTMTFALRAVDPGGVGNLVDDARIELLEPPPPPGETTIGGAVVDAGGAGVAGVGVDLFTENRAGLIASTTTDGAGRYGFTVDPDSCYVLTFIAPAGRRLTGPGANSGGQYLNRDVCVDDGPSDGNDATVTGGAAGQSVGGAVTESGGGPVAEIQVDLFAAAADGSRAGYLATAATGQDGSYGFDLPAAGCYVHTFVAPEGRSFVGGSRWLNLGYCAEAGEVVAGIDAVLEGGQPGGGIGDRVTDSGGGPVAGVQVDLFVAAADGSRSTFLAAVSTDGDGRYRHDAGAGCYVVVFIAPEGRTFVASGGRFLERAVCLDPGETDDTIDAVLA